MQINNIQIGKNQKPYIIAEMSGNHNQSLDRALKIVEEAAHSGADAIKLQTYTADTLTIDKSDGDFYLNDPNSLWHGMSMFELYKKAYTPWEWHYEIFEKSKELGITCFSSPFDSTAVDFLESLNCPCYKIASTENTDTNLLKKVAKTGKPVIVSIGMATVEDIGLISDTLQNNGCSKFALLKCTAAYPADPKESNLATIAHLKKLFNCEVGLSDHTLGISVPIAAVALGATIIEKHLTLSRIDGGVDSAFSLEPKEFKALVEETNSASLSIGSISYGSSNSENATLSRRSLYIVENMKAGDILTEKNLRSIRPGYGLQAKYYEIVLGMRINKNVSRGTRLSWGLLKK